MHVGIATGVPQTAADLLHRASRQLGPRVAVSIEANPDAGAAPLAEHRKKSAMTCRNGAG
jgi:hypothetical protein